VAAAVHNNDDTQALWAQTVDRVKQAVIAPALWRALEKTVAVVWEGESFVVGFGAMDGGMASQLNTRDYRLAIERALRELSGQALTLRIIEGTELSDWEYTKTRDAAAEAQRTQTVVRRQKEASAFGTWDEVYDQVSRLWATFELRALPTGRARYIDAALALVLKAMEGGLYNAPADGSGAPADELTERGLSRVMERIAGMTNSDPAVIAYLLFQRRKGGAASE
jgi:hypothetical protein